MENLTARHVMTGGVATVSPVSSVENVVRLISKKSFSGFPVVNSQGKVVGVVTMSDLLRRIAGAIGAGEFSSHFGADEWLSDSFKADGVAKTLAKFMSQPIERIMTTKVESCSPTTPLDAVCRTMIEKKIHRVLVIEEGSGKLAGIVTSTDLIRQFGKVLAGEAGQPPRTA